MQPICLVSRRRSGPGSVVTPRISRVITPAPLSNVTRGELEFDPPPLPLLQNGYSRATAFRTSPFTRVNGSRVLEFIRSIKIEANGSLSRAKEKHIYIYTSGTRIYSWWVPVQIVTSLTVLLVLPIRISSSSLSLSSCSNISARLRICEPDDMS